MEIRPAKPTDRNEWGRMRTRLFSNPDPQEIDDWFDAAERGGTSRVGVAVIVADRGDGSLAGFVEIGSRNYAEGCETTPVAYLEGWYVDPDVRRIGLGANLLKAAETWALAHGFSEIASDTELDNDVSLQAHTGLGFEEVERQICFKKRLR
ncbi:MAG: GNAT family N-acetyltransferase [Woeseiaceae bacterium]|nr:GNAT family N-acetyltransferase [Woeseiaceae bacterium]